MPLCIEPCKLHYEEQVQKNVVFSIVIAFSLVRACGKVTTSGRPESEVNYDFVQIQTNLTNIGIRLVVTFAVAYLIQ